MKKLMFAISLAGLLGLGASAAVESANTFGVLKVTSSQAQTIIAVPWVDVGSGSAINIADLVMTSNLTARDTTTSASAGTGDMLYYYNGTNYDAWELTQDGSTGAKVWTAAIGVSANGITSSDPAVNTSVLRGKALILVRNATTQPIYLYGQYTSDRGETVITPNAWNLIAPSTTANIQPTASNIKSGTPNATDYFVLSGAPTKRYFYNSESGKWVYDPLVGDDVELTIPAGTGAWYVSRGENALTFQW